MIAKIIDQIAEHIDHARREKLVQRIDVRRQPRHHPADRILIVIRDLLLLKLCKELGPQIEHHPLPDVIQQNFLQVAKKKRNRKRPKKASANSQMPSVCLGVM